MMLDALGALEITCIRYTMSSASSGEAVDIHCMSEYGPEVVVIS